MRDIVILLFNMLCMYSNNPYHGHYRKDSNKSTFERSNWVVRLLTNAANVILIVLVFVALVSFFGMILFFLFNMII